MEPHARTLRAAWSGAWRPPWILGKGRRFGDLSWSLASVGIAWLQGGSEGAWPQQAWSSGPYGPRPEGPPQRWRERPDPRWISLLRHGTANLAEDWPGPRESILEGMAWEALLRGHALPFLNLGLIHLDQATRARWVPLLGAVDGDGCLHLPPFLAPLIPEALRVLPSGWWEILLSHMDAEGLLLPSGSLPACLAHIQPETLSTLVSSRPLQGLPGSEVLALPEERWMASPQLRAWARGEGASPRAILALQPQTLGLGAEPDPEIRAFLDFRLPAGLPESWRPSLEADLTENPFPAPPPALGMPTWDWLRVRWDGACPESSPGYPDPAAPPGGSCDPFHAMALGWNAFRAGDLEKALWEFAFSHAHFRRLKAPDWASRACHNAIGAAYFWGDLPRCQAFRKLAGTLDPPYNVLQEIRDLILMGRFQNALERTAELEGHPRAAAEVLGLKIHCLINLGAWEALHAFDPASLPSDLARILAAIQSRSFFPRPLDLDEESALLWESVRARMSDYEQDRFWIAWDACPNALMRLGTGLLVMEARPEARIPSRLVQLQELAHRCGSEVLIRRLSALWPEAIEPEDPAPRERLERLLGHHPGPAWILWGESWEERLGQGDVPPPALRDLLFHRDHLDPMSFGGWIWWMRSLRWEGAPVGWLLLGFAPDRPLHPPHWADLLAPWASRLSTAAPPVPAVEGRALLTNGSEPMAAFLRELDQVAPSRLPILLQGASGSGKELAAREIHLRSGRKGPLVAVNCSEFASGVLESELFGHVKGAFTGATRDKVGAVEGARDGTLFLDEVADLEPRLQSMLLRVLQEREIRRVGSDRPIPVDVRFVAATHRDLDILVREGRFRKDLLFRLQGASLSLPSLDERRHELPWLFPRLVVQICREEHLPAPALAPGIAQALARRRWPGNFRELRHVLQRALLRAQGGTLSSVHFPELAEPAVLNREWEDATREFQRKLLADTLKAHDFQVAEAARALGLARPALYAAAKRLGIDLVAERRGGRHSSASK